MPKLSAIWKPALLGAIASALAACAGQPIQQQPTRNQPQVYAPSQPGAQDSLQDARGRRVADLALSMVGKPYLYGGSDPKGFDCSGLVFYSYTRFGIDVPRTSMQQYRRARKIGLADAQVGDIVFFQDQAQLSHVGIYVGNDMFVHAPTSGRRVSIASLSAPYYRQHLVAVGRLHDF
jgi:cell wall-associated NlpC family hydrolase